MRPAALTRLAGSGLGQIGSAQQYGKNCEGSESAMRVAAALDQLMVPVHAVTPHPDNPRAASTEAIQESIVRNGVYRPIYAQESSGCIIAGHHLYAAMVELGFQQVPVLWVDVDDTTAKRILLADNRIADLGTYDDGLLLEALKELAVEDEQGLLGTGYDLDDMKKLEKVAESAFTPSRSSHDTPTTAPANCPTCGKAWR